MLLVTYTNPCFVYSQVDSTLSPIKIQNLGTNINSPANELAPVLKADGSFFFLKNNSKSVNSHEFENGAYLVQIDSSKTNYGKSTLLSSTSNNFSKFSDHDAIITLIKNDSVLYTLKNNSIHYSILQNEIWTESKNLSSEINFNIYKNHFSITNDGKTIYFSAKNKIGYGGYDIYSATILATGKWDIPKNLGHFINTVNDELSPEISKDGKTLYFSSNGHKELGGFDMYKTYMVNKYWTEPVNMGSPINTAGDEIFMKISSDEQYALYSSTRAGGNGGYDLYKISSSGLVSKSSGIVDIKKASITSDFPFVVNAPANCIPYINKDFIVTLDASKSIDSSGKNIEIEWVFDDGTKEKGIKTTHRFKTPGKHNVAINAIDPANNKVELEDAFQEVLIEGIDYVGFICPDTININDTVIFDGSYSYITGKKITIYLWKLGESVLKENPAKLIKAINTSGEVKLEMTIYTEDKLSYCFTKTLIVKSK